LENIPIDIYHRSTENCKETLVNTQSEQRTPLKKTPRSISAAIVAKTLAPQKQKSEKISISDGLKKTDFLGCQDEYEGGFWIGL